MKAREVVPAEALQNHSAVLGKTGSGKTSTAKLIIEQVVAGGARACVLDPIKSDWWGLTSSADGKRAGLPFYILGGPRGHVPLHAGAGKAIAEIVASGALPHSIIDMADFEPGGQAKFFTEFAPILLRRMKGVLYLVLEEAHLFAPKERSGIGAENMAIHWAKTLASAGRSKGIRLIVVTHRVQSLHNALLGSCENLIAHRVTLPADQEPMIKWIKGNVPPTVNHGEIIGSLSSLKTGTAWLCCGEARIFEQRQFPRIRTYDNTATPTDDTGHEAVKTAPVDQEKLHAIIGEAVKEAESNDPKLLRAEITRLKAEASKKQHAGPTPAWRAEYEGAHARDTENAYQRGRVDGFAEAQADNAGKITEALTHMKQGVGVLGDALKSTARRLAAPVASRPVPKTYPKRHTPDIQSGLPPARQKILDQVLWLREKGISPAPKEALAAVCGVSSTSGGYFNNLGALRSAGYIDYPTPGTVDLTAQGAANAVPPADNGRSVYECWLDIVTPAQRAILGRLFSAHPRPMEKDQLARDIGVSETSGGYFNNLGRLRTIGAVDYPKRGFVGLTKHVIPT